MFEFPNMKETFIPDHGFTLFEVDLAGADAQVVACTAGNEAQKEAFKRGIKIHTHNGRAVFGAEKMGPDGKADPYYTRAKKGAHATNYGARNAAKRCGMSQSDWAKFQADYFKANPSIKEWHQRTEFNLQTTHKVKNAFGYDIQYFDRPSSCFNQALAWEPQSTVAIVTFEAMELLHPYDAWIQLLLQVHDSLVGQIPTKRLKEGLRILHQVLHSITIPFPDEPWVIPWGLKLSSTSWGHMQDVKWEAYLNDETSLPKLAASVC